MQFSLGSWLAIKSPSDQTCLDGAECQMDSSMFLQLGRLWSHKPWLISEGVFTVPLACFVCKGFDVLQALFSSFIVWLALQCGTVHVFSLILWFISHVWMWSEFITVTYHVMWLIVVYVSDLWTFAFYIPSKSFFSCKYLWFKGSDTNHECSSVCKCACNSPNRAWLWS